MDHEGDRFCDEDVEPSMNLDDLQDYEPQSLGSPVKLEDDLGKAVTDCGAKDSLIVPELLDEDDAKTGIPIAHNPKEEEDDEITFEMGNRKPKSEKSPAEIAMSVEKVMSELEIAADDDTKLNREGKPAVNKLMKLPLLTQALSEKHLQLEFLDRGVLNVLSNWLEPLPDGSLPSTSVRTTVLKILTDLPIDLDQHCTREQVKKGGLGKVIVFLSKVDEEASNRKLAKDLAENWSRSLFNKDQDDGQIPSRRPCQKTMPQMMRPEAFPFPMGFVVLSDQKDNYELVKNKLLQPLKAPGKKSLLAVKPSADIRAKKPDTSMQNHSFGLCL